MTQSIPRCITAVPGIRVGHATDRVGLTGRTVIPCEKGAAGLPAHRALHRGAPA